ncbi:MAG: sigma-70 family RNA polymerase sigma factor [Ktedonobacteraceae bacterium]|nr:sigma-70 family RNA polymerase sigma factor [Ktedonobacteraceae bacterium]
MIRGHEQGQQESQSVQQYLQDIAQFPLLSAGEEQTLAQQIAAGDRGARDQLINANLRLAVSVAKQYARRGVELLDLIQEANIGLIKAAEKFDAAKGRFSTYATWWMQERLIQVLSRPRELSLEQEEMVSMETLVDVEPTAEEIVYLQQLNAHLYATFTCLTERERLVLVLRYGLDGQDHNRSLAQVAGKLGISVTRVRQIEQDALRKLRASGSGVALKDYWSERNAS